MCYNCLNGGESVRKLFIFLNLFILLFLFSCSTQYTRKDFYLFAMSTEIYISFYNVDNPETYVRDIEDIYIKYSNVASDYDPGFGVKNVYNLNQERSIEARPELIEMIRFALEMKEETNGYFEPLLGRLSHAWKEALDNGELLSEEVVNQELEIIKTSSILIEGNKVSIIGEANLDLGGIAKGYATNEVKKYLDDKGISSYMLNAGSSNLVLGTKNGDKFSVGFSFPFEGGNYKVLDLINVCVGTSSMQHQHLLLEGKYYSHLLNPKTGYPAMYYDSLSIFGADSARLDAYSTACFAMDIEDMKEFLREKGYDFLAIKDADIYESEGFVYE